MTMTKEQVLKNLEKFLGKVLYVGSEMQNECECVTCDDIICAFEDYEEFGESYVIIDNLDHYGDRGYTMSVYIDVKRATEFLFFLDTNYVITDIHMGQLRW